MPNLLITGASRGLGREFVGQYATEGWRVFACCRDPKSATELQKLAAASGGKVTVHALDVTDLASVRALAKALSGESLDMVINNAGVSGTRGEALGKIDYAAWPGVFDANVMGPLRVAEAFAPLLEKGGKKLLVSISSRMGSVAENSGGSYAYRASKAALNMVNSNLSIELKDKGIACVVLHPGWVSTDMGGPSAPVKPPDSVAGMRTVIAGLGAKDSGSFRDFQGGAIPW